MNGKRESFSTFWRGVRGEGDNWDVMDATGLSYESRTQAICSWLGFCGCGAPEDALQTIVDVLSSPSAVSQPGTPAAMLHQISVGQPVPDSDI